jgi:hypothetical protein
MNLIMMNNTIKYQMQRTNKQITERLAAIVGRYRPSV